MPKEALERLLRSQGFGSRKDCRTLIRQGVVRVHGEVCDDPYAEFFTLDPDSGEAFRFAVEDADWTWCAHAVVVLNKPTGYECSQKPIHHPSVMTLLPAPLRTRDVQPIGRLDEDTTGLLILTDDGQLNHRLSSPKRRHPKVYHVTCKHPVDDTQIAALCAGVQLHDEPAPIAAAAATLLPDGRLELTLREGKYHQVKRMVAAAGNRVESLQRVAIGHFWLPPELAPGQWRFLSADEIAALESAGDA